jgi:hypothetical protein
MAIPEVRSPWSHERPNRNADRGIGTSPLSSPRSDGGHLNPLSGKGWTPAKLMRKDNKLAHDMATVSSGTGNRPLVPKR